jgi:short-subunit dehydrogenase
MSGPRELAGRRALVTGAAAGIGRATAIALARAGVVIEAVDRDATGLDSVALEIAGLHAATPAAAADGGDSPRAGRWVIDLSRAEEVEDLVARIEEEAGPIDLLVNVAGIGLQASVLQMTEAELRRLFEIDFFATVSLCRQALRVMAPRRRGQIINVSSASARRGLPGMSGYAAAKSAVHGFTQALRLEGRRHGVAVTEVLPISVRTGFFQAAENRSARPYRPGGFIQTPEYVAEIIVRCARRPVAERLTAPILRPAFALDALLPNLVERLATWYYRNAPAE